MFYVPLPSLDFFTFPKTLHYFCSIRSIHWHWAPCSIETQTNSRPKSRLLCPIESSVAVKKRQPTGFSTGDQADISFLHLSGNHQGQCEGQLAPTENGRTNGECPISACLHKVYPCHWCNQIKSVCQSYGSHSFCFKLDNPGIMEPSTGIFSYRRILWSIQKS